MPLFTEPGEDVSGRISAFALSDLFELARLFDKKGVLRAVGSDGRWGTYHFCPGGLWGISSGHLEGVEAALTMLHWQDGLFRIFLTPDASPPSELLQSNHLVLEHARLQDEFERLSGHFPGAKYPLILKRRPPDGGDALACGLQDVERAVSKFPGITCGQLEHLLPLAPLKIHLAVAALASEGKISGRSPKHKTMATSQGCKEEWWRRAMARHRGVLRVLIAFPLRGCTDGVRRGIAQLAEEVGGTAPEVRFSTHTPVFARIRTKEKGLLSLTFLPETHQHGCLFEAFAHSSNIVLVCGARSKEERVWLNALPPGVTGAVFGASCDGNCTLTETLRGLAESHSALRVPKNHQAVPD